MVDESTKHKPSIEPCRDKESTISPTVYDQALGTLRTPRNHQKHTNFRVILYQKDTIFNDFYTKADLYSESYKAILQFIENCYEITPTSGGGIQETGSPH